MIVATLMVYGYKHQINWSEWRFVQLPSAGDIVAVKDHRGNLHYATVRHTEYKGSSIHRDDGEPSAIVITDWKESFPPSERDGPIL